MHSEFFDDEFSLPVEALGGGLVGDPVSVLESVLGLSCPGRVLCAACGSPRVLGNHPHGRWCRREDTDGGKNLFRYGSRPAPCPLHHPGVRTQRPSRQITDADTALSGFLRVLNRRDLPPGISTPRVAPCAAVLHCSVEYREVGMAKEDAALPLALYLPCLRRGVGGLGCYHSATKQLSAGACFCR